VGEGKVKSKNFTFQKNRAKKSGKRDTYALPVFDQIDFIVIIEL